MDSKPGCEGGCDEAGTAWCACGLCVDVSARDCVRWLAAQCAKGCEWDGEGTDGASILRMSELRMSTIIVSQVCRFILESKGPRAFCQRWTAFVLQGGEGALQSVRCYLEWKRRRYRLGFHRCAVISRSVVLGMRVQEHSGVVNRLLKQRLNPSSFLTVKSLLKVNNHFVKHIKRDKKTKLLLDFLY